MSRSSWQPGSSTAAEAAQSAAELRLMFGGGAENADERSTHSLMILTASLHNDGLYTRTTKLHYVQPSQVLGRVIVLGRVNRGWLRGPAVEHWSLANVLSLSCARLVADG